MIDLKNVIEKYPQSLSNGKILKSILLDLYPAERLYGDLLAQILDDGIVEEIKSKDKIDSIEFINLCNKVENKHGTAKKYIEGCLTIWANAFDIPIKTKVEPIKRIVTPTSQSESAIHSHEYTTTVVPPTCTEKGYTLHSCNCGYEYKDNFVNVKHDYVLVEYTEPTCEADGKELYKCIHCGDEKTEIIKAKGHKFGKWVEQIHATCLKDGYEIRECSECGKIEKRTIAKTGHNFSECRKEGENYVWDCCKCGFAEKKGLPIEKIGQILEFGRYPQGSDGGILPIKWRVLDINNKKALLLSVYGLEVKSYKNRYKKGDWGYTSWSKSGIRRWLNNDFYTQAFSDKETERIIASENDNVIHVEYDRRPRIRTRHAVSTTDNVFLLSVSDVELYLGLKKNTKVEDLNANVELTEMANTLSFSDKDLYYLRLNKYTAVKVPWLLRDSERDLCGFYSAEIVSGNYIGDCSYGSKFAICPAIWVDLSTAEELEQKKKEELEQKKKEEIEKKRLEEEQERKRLEEEEQALKAAEEKRKAEALKAERRRNGVCQYCGGKFKGLFIKKCSVCGNRKNY